MIIVDTNVVSEAVRASPEQRVSTWIAQQDPGELHLSAVVLGELLAGVRMMADGRRRRRLASTIASLVTAPFNGRVVAFDRDAAESYATVLERRRAAGRPIAPADAMIAATALARGAAVATRNTRDFDGTGVRVIDPWAA